MEPYRHIVAAYLYVSEGMGGAVMMYDIKEGTAIVAPTTWCMNAIWNVRIRV